MNLTDECAKLRNEVHRLNLQISELREAWLTLVGKADIASQAPKEFLALTDLFKGVVEKQKPETCGIMQYEPPTPCGLPLPCAVHDLEPDLSIQKRI